MEAAKLDGAAVRIGLQHFGHPRAFYRLSKGEQIDVLATLTNEHRPAQGRGNDNEREALPITFGNKQAASWWAS